MHELNRKCVSLLSGGLDSTLATKMMLAQDIEVEAINFRLPFGCCKLEAHKAASDLGVQLTVVEVGDDYYDVIRRPRHGYGRGVNPCLDCHIYMLRKAARFAEQVGASFVVTGEVIGQRPNSQKRGDLAIGDEESGLGDRLLRPLSAKQLPPTLPERAGLVDRSRLLGHAGRGRGRLIDLARELGLRHIPSASPGCRLTQQPFARAIRDLLAHVEEPTPWDFKLTQTGRQLRLGSDAKVVLGRNKQDNDVLAHLHADAGARPHTYIRPLDFKGPDAVLVGEPTPERVEQAAQLVLKWSKRYNAAGAEFEIIEPLGRATATIPRDTPPAYEDLLLGQTVEQMR